MLPKCGSISNQKLKDNHDKANKSGIGFSSLDFVVAQPDSKNWFYTMSQLNTCWNDQVYDSMLSSQHKEPSHEIKRLSEMLPTYISYSGLLKNTERTVWSSLESYKDKMSNVTGDLNDTPFDVEYIEDIAQQVSGSLDCGVFMAGYAEFLSDQIQIPSSNLDAEYLRKRYTTLL
ncbi:hypothetical protein CQW23_09538 [Capsicum baccatum]|uniref:Ubiquitin-like protease family profile domain-containing protein n=1 Tax=Capsicum baccatum TaxID=33114 RepID=A0A2G2WX70_CAPBA|nr:hypothetical protein CQW23_09538 [Capsicum baccatum]